jgi:tRNA(fMet)-specific endonuclease VapC
MTARYLVDTSAVILHLRRPGGALGELFESEGIGSFVLCPMVKSELLVGTLLAADPAAQYERLRVLFDHLPSTPVTDNTAVFAAEIDARLRRASQRVPGNDLWIGALALQHELAVVTANVEHFRRMGGVRVHPVR